MKVIDLLNKIASGEQPKKIKYHDTIYNFEEYKGEWGYVNIQYGKYKWFAKEIDCDLSNCLNDEVEIIEELQEHKIPEKIIIGKKQPVHRIKKIEKKINETLDYLEEIE